MTNSSSYEKDLKRCEIFCCIKRLSNSYGCHVLNVKTILKHKKESINSMLFFFAFFFFTSATYSLFEVKSGLEAGQRNGPKSLAEGT